MCVYGVVLFDFGDEFGAVEAVLLARAVGCRHVGCVRLKNDLPRRYHGLNTLLELNDTYLGLFINVHGRDVLRVWQSRKAVRLVLVIE